MFAAHHRLSALTVLVDANNSQVDGPVDTITTIEPVAAKWASFGWEPVELDGHDVHAVSRGPGGRTGRDPPGGADLPDLDQRTGSTACRPTPTATSSSCRPG